MSTSILVLLVSTVLVVLGQWYLHNYMIRVVKGKYRTLAIHGVVYPTLSGAFSAAFVGMQFDLTVEQVVLAGTAWCGIFFAAPLVYEIFRDDEKK